MLTVKLCELCPTLHQWNMDYSYDIFDGLHKYLFYCASCMSWKKIVTPKELQISNFVRLGIDFKFKEK